MRFKRRRKSNNVNSSNCWNIFKKFVIFFTTICVVPILLIKIITSDNYDKSVRYPLERLQLTNSQRLQHFNMTLIINRNEKRRLHLKRACTYMGLDKPGNDSLHKPNPWEFLINYKYRLIWCNVFKAASTSWMYNFNILAGYSPKFLKKSNLVPLSLARQKYPRPSLQNLLQAFNNSISFVIVRHPLERLLSAYRDKLEFSLPHTHHRKLGNGIIKKYRNEKIEQKTPTFSEFIRYLLDCVKQKEILDMHWTPIAEFCTPCMYNFTVLAHTETLDEDSKYIIQLAHLEKLIQSQWKNARHGTTTDKKIRNYYSQLTKKQILQLFNIYRFDFELFDYTLKGYLELGKPDR